jgi:hypothetical protein
MPFFVSFVLPMPETAPKKGKCAGDNETKSVWFVGVGFLECRIKPRLQCHPD